MKQFHISFYIYIFIFQIYTQNIDAQDCYPLEIGNQWIYIHLEFDPRVSDGKYLVDTLTVNVINDTTLKGRHYFVLDNIDFSGGKIIRADSNNIYYYDEKDSSDKLFYRLDAQINDYWITKLNGKDNKILLLSIDSKMYYGTLTNIYRFQVGDYPWNFVEISKDFGIIRYYYSGAIEIHNNLIGCKLDNNYFGNIVSIAYDYFSTNILKLYQNYPNPFNSSTTISFEIPKPLYIDLYLINSLGRKVNTIYSGKKEKGFYSFLVDFSKLSSGIYYFKLITNNFFIIKKCLFLK